MAALILFLLLSFNISSAKTQPRNSNNITIGSSLSPNNNSYWPSESGLFAFGFYRNGNGFSLGIWFQKIQQKTVVWTANRDEAPFPPDVTLSFSAGGRLILQQKDDQETLIANAPQAAFSASVLDSGNFVLLDSNGKIIWQTFDFPTDTILPGQPLRAGNMLVSSISETNHKSGKFQLIMQRDGNLVQYPVNTVESDYAYWNTETNTAGDNVSLNLNSDGHLYLINATGFNIRNITNGLNLRVPGEEDIYRATLGADGIFRLYSQSLDQSSNWSIEWESSYDKCDPTGSCGLNSYCALVDGEAECLCPMGYDYIDQSQKDLGCHRSFISDSCASRNGNSTNVYELNGVSWDDVDQYSTLSNIPKEACREECFNDCNCEAVQYEIRGGKQECKKLKLPLRYGRRRQSYAVTTFYKIGAGGSGKTGGKANNNSELRLDIFITGIVFLVVASLVLASAGLLVYRYRAGEYRRVLDQEKNGFLEDVTLRQFKFEELQRATNNFADEIGRGTFGTVFRGVISNRKRTVAIKRLEKLVAEGEREFQNEVRAIGRTHHRNLVQLLGYSHDGGNRLLVYEYMSNGSLAGFLFGSRGKRETSWEGRIRIALDIARGLLYLHEECETQIIHCDIKPENILMDEKECARIADFGLAKLLMPSQTRTYTGIRGTRGYVAPEWHRNLPITVKVDVYSYGIMLLEIICCRRSMDMGAPEDEIVLVNWVYDCFEAGEVERLVQLQGEEVEKKKLEKMVKVGLWCTQEEPSLRPTMKKVVLMLEGTVEIPAPPCPTSFISCI